MKIDIKKAFDSVPHCVIHRKLRELHVQDNIIKYIMNFVQLRYSALNGQNSCGIAQGDPLSMWLFCISINDVLKELDREDIKFIAYADDLVIQLENPKDAEDMVDHCASLFEKSVCALTWINASPRQIKTKYRSWEFNLASTQETYQSQ